MANHKGKKQVKTGISIKKTAVYVAFWVTVWLLASNVNLFGKVLLWESLPGYVVAEKENAYLKPGLIFEDDTGIQVENDVDIYNNNLIGIRNVVFQDEEEFSQMAVENYELNLDHFNIDALRNTDYLLKNFYNKDRNTGIIPSYFDVDRFLAEDVSIVKNGDEPQVLIFHTHAGTEFFIDSDKSDLEEGVVGAGSRLQYVLENKYGIQSIHHKGVYDAVNGVSDRNGSYERMEGEIQKILRDNPSIELVIDVHRDGIEPDPQLVNYIDNKPYAKLMFVNGVSALNENGEAKPIESLKNPNLDANLALSFQMQMAASEIYPNSTRKIYLKAYRFSTFMLPKSLLVEIGCQYNTKEEAFNSMEILADLVESVIFTD